MINALPNDILNYGVCIHLSFLDVFALRLTCARLDRKINKALHCDFRKVVCARLSRSYVNPDALLRALHTTKHILYGSLLIQCLLGEVWPDANVNVLCLTPIDGPTYERHDSALDMLTTQEPDALKEHVDAGWVHIESSWSGLWVRADRVDENDALHFLDHHHLAHDEDRHGLTCMSRWVRQRCDFSFVKVSYDCNRGLQIWDVDSLWSRSCRMSIEKFQCLHRKYSWENDDYNEGGGVDRTQDLEFRIAALRERVKKYQRRGFSVLSDLPAYGNDERYLLQRWLQLRRYDVLVERNEDLAGEFESLDRKAARDLSRQRQVLRESRRIARKTLGDATRARKMPKHTKK